MVKIRKSLAVLVISAAGLGVLSIQGKLFRFTD